jgi:S-adenosylmethionine:tRNA ribosyltransferase-isomerase
MPLPPYIHREAREPESTEDRERYQTVYSQHGGSAAAPTAGLHFTEEILGRLRVSGVEIARVTLHVGLGTFQPVRVEDTGEIRLHAESYTLSAEAAEALNRAWREGRRIVAVGTTTTRTLEHVARRFEAEHGALSKENPLRLEAHAGSTRLFLSPEGDAEFKIVRGLLTNFHLPESTLLMLVSAFAGRGNVLRAYAHAVAERYRFFSYGDCMLVL